MTAEDCIAKFNSERVLSRPTAEKCLALVERVIASQGEHAEPLLVKLQHELVSELRPISPDKK